MLTFLMFSFGGSLMAFLGPLKHKQEQQQEKHTQMGKRKSGDTFRKGNLTINTV